MELPGTADTKTSRASMSSAASTAAVNRQAAQGWELQQQRWGWQQTYLHALFQWFQPSWSSWVISWRVERWSSGQECQQICGSYLCPRVQSWRDPAPSGHCCGKSSFLCGGKKKRKVQLKLPRDMKCFGLHYFKETAGKGKLMWQGKSQRAREQALSKIPFKEPKHDADRCSFHNCSWRQAIIFSFLFIIFISTSYFLFISFYILHIYTHTHTYIYSLSTTEEVIALLPYKH